MVGRETGRSTHDERWRKFHGCGWRRRESGTTRAPGVGLGLEQGRGGCEEYGPITQLAFEGLTDMGRPSHGSKSESQPSIRISLHPLGDSVAWNGAWVLCRDDRAKTLIYHCLGGSATGHPALVSWENPDLGLKIGQRPSTSTSQIDQ